MVPDTDSGIQLHSDYVSIEITDVNAVETVIAQILAGGRVCQEHQIFRLAIFVPRPPSPQLSTLQIFRIVSAVVPQWNRRVRVALIVATWAEPLKEFALLTTHNRGINLNMFATEAEALAFLRA